MIFARRKFNQLCFFVYCTVTLFVVTQATVCAHVYEDGFVERSLTITIRDGVGYGEYRIGLNVKTAGQILELSEQLSEKDVRPKSLQDQPNAADHQAHRRTTQPVTSPKNLNTSKASDSNKTADANKANDSSKATVPQVSPPKLDTAGSGEHLTDLATIKRFGDLRQQWFTDHLKLSSDGQAIPLSKVSVEPAGRHPYSVLVKFQFSFDEEREDAGLPVDKESHVQSEQNTAVAGVVNFRVTDDLFAGHSGATRYSLRARGTTMLLQSNVAPVLVRAERIEINQNATSREKKLPAIQAKLNLGGS